jgi:hypothetical protein
VTLPPLPTASMALQLSAPSVVLSLRTAGAALSLFHQLVCPFFLLQVMSLTISAAGVILPLPTFGYSAFFFQLV